MKRVYLLTMKAHPMKNQQRKTFSVILVGFTLSAVIGLFITSEISLSQNWCHAADTVVPTEWPDRIVLSWSSDDCATTQSVTWRTSARIRDASAELAEADATLDFAGNAKSFAAKCEPIESEGMTYHSHSVTFTGLKPDTMYYYRVRGAHWSEWFSFTTASQGDQPFTFLFFGDTQTGLNSTLPPLIRRAFLTAPEAAFAVFSGDLVNGSDERSWSEWFNALGFLAAHYPIMPVPGNHEYDENGLTHLWRPLFTLPENGPPATEETCYTFTYNGVRMIGLESYRDEIAGWLEDVLKNNACRWTIVYFHCPIYSPAKGRDEGGWRQTIKPIFDKYQIDLVLQGHDHVYSRTGMHTPKVDAVDLVNVRDFDPDSRTVYVTSTACDKMYEMEEKPLFAKMIPNIQLFQVIKIDGNTLTFTANTATGRVVDSFVLEKP